MEGGSVSAGTSVNLELTFLGETPFLGNARQLNLIEYIKRQSEQTGNSPGDFNLQSQLKHALTEALKRCPLSRYEVTARMSELLDFEITK